MCVCNVCVRREPTPHLHSLSTAVCAITARFIVSQRTMNELQGRSFQRRSAVASATAAADAVVFAVVFVVVV